MKFKGNHEQQNQENYNTNAATHSQLGLNSTLFLAYRDIPGLLNKYLFDKVKKQRYKVLDFGCGAGLSTELITKMISEAGYEAEILGIDISDQNIKYASERIANAQFCKINPGDSLVNLGKFDLIICNFVLVESKQETMINILKDIHSLLNDTGISIITNCASKAYRKSNKWYTFNNNFDENVPSELKKGKIKFAEDQPIKVQVFASYGNELSFTFFDFFHSGESYRKAYKAVGLNLLQTHKPMGNDFDEIEWESERQYSPYKIHILSRDPQPEMQLQNNIGGM